MYPINPLEILYVSRYVSPLTGQLAAQAGQISLFMHLHSNALYYYVLVYVEDSIFRLRSYDLHVHVQE